ncbi:hypothetical protein LZ32DRAFT_612103 [Colletotrichum eremochloae]|nr:hypothetical protein LZ32DRAFT_612103 [Colletotrichum eremochloae]
MLLSADVSTRSTGLAPGKGFTCCAWAASPPPTAGIASCRKVRTRPAPSPPLPSQTT